MVAIDVHHLSKSYGRKDHVRAVDDLSLSVEEGELLVLLGPSGCGKTTLLRCLAGLVEPTSGRISLGDRVVYDAERRLNVPAHHRDLGMVFQGFALWPHMSVQKNVGYPLRARRRGARDTGARVAALLEAVKCADLAPRLPSQLSGGQQQRVALARALAADPSVVLFDEPLSNLDALLRHDLRFWLAQIREQIGFTGVYVTHDQEEALQLGTRIAVMRAGRIEQIGVPEVVFEHPATPYVAEFFGIRNRLTLRSTAGTWVVQQSGVALEPPLPGLPDPSEGESCELYLRSEDLRMLPSAGAGAVPSELVPLGQGRVRTSVYAGRRREYSITLGDSELRVLAESTTPLYANGTVVSLAFTRGHGLAYQEGGQVTAATDRQGVAV